MQTIRLDIRTLGGPLAAAALATPAAAQEQDIDTALRDWNYDQAYDGWRAEEFLDNAEIFGVEGEEIGTVENLLIDETGQVVALVAQVGGFWDIGDTHIAVPWNEAEFEGYQVQIPVNEDNVGDYSLFQDEYFTRADVGDLETVDDDLEAGYHIWKATNLIDDYAVLETGEGFGYVDDLIFDNGGMLQSVIVNATGDDYLDPGYYGYPWYGYGYDDYAWSPGLDYYTLPYDEDEIGEFATAFDYDEVEGGLY